MQNDEHDDNINLDEVDYEYDKNELLFWIICYVLSLLSLINLNVYAINTC